MGLAENLAKRVFAQQIDQLNTTIGMLLEAVAQLQDEERGWRLVGSDSTAELQPDAIREIMREAQEAWLRNPLAGQIVLIKRVFTLGAGISFVAEDSQVQDWLRRFWNDPANKMFLRQIDIFDSLQVYGELYVRFFEAPTGDVRVRLIPPIQIADVITDPEDIDTPIAFRREWTERRYKAIAHMKKYRIRAATPKKYRQMKFFSSR